MLLSVTLRHQAEAKLKKTGSTRFNPIKDLDMYYPANLLVIFFCGIGTYA